MLVVGVAVEMTDFTHNLIGIQQPSVRTVERKTDDGMLKDLAVLIRQFFLPDFLLAQLRLVAQCADDTLGGVRTRCHFHHAHIVHIAPLGLFAIEVEVPAIEELVARYLARHHPAKMPQRLLQVIGMHMAFPFFRRHYSVGEDMSVELVDISFANHKAHHIAGADLHRLFHHLTRKRGFCHALAHTSHHQAVLDEHAQKGQRHQHTNQRGDELKCPSGC